MESCVDISVRFGFMLWFGHLRAFSIWHCSGQPKRIQGTSLIRLASENSQACTRRAMSSPSSRVDNATSKLWCCLFLRWAQCDLRPRSAVLIVGIKSIVCRTVLVFFPWRDATQCLRDIAAFARSRSGIQFGNSFLWSLHATRGYMLWNEP